MVSACETDLSIIQHVCPQNDISRTPSAETARTVHQCLYALGRVVTHLVYLELCHPSSPVQSLSLGQREDPHGRRLPIARGARPLCRWRTRRILGALPPASCCDSGTSVLRCRTKDVSPQPLPSSRTLGLQGDSWVVSEGRSTCERRDFLYRWVSCRPK